MAHKAWQVIPRLATGAFILEQGLGKRDADAETAKGLHGMAASAYPVLEDVEPEAFLRTLSTAEIAVGSALLAPFVPARLAGLGLSAFSGALVGLYTRIPGLRREGSLRPTPDGTAIAKDSWMLAIGLALIVDSFTRRRSRGEE